MEMEKRFRMKTKPARFWRAHVDVGIDLSFGGNKVGIENGG
ncbi:hypothetical protein SLEP1_g19870 [Rubroshorea leprosula]|uniref:Uncharacterized protein n=1 Tax=Rubroshorea leprosula TaxID=152421 RepID=A0AAV5J6T1_9ROSI|nr:hypothetical protein SLEP1_g19870 [Rubroshorea leprosula]